MDQSSKSTQVAIKSIGCLYMGLLRNYRRYFDLNGYVVTDSMACADYILLVTCGTNENRVKFAEHYISMLMRQKKKHAKILVTGCLPKIGVVPYSPDDGVYVAKTHQDIDAFFSAKVSVGSVGSYHLPEEIYRDTFTQAYRVYELSRCTRFCLSRNILVNLWGRLLVGFYMGLYRKKRIEKKYTIITHEGCNNQCSYCAVRFAIGNVRSKSIQDIINEVHAGIQAGYKDFIISSNDFGQYGADNGTRAIDLLEKLLSIDRDICFDLIYVHPKWLFDNRSKLVPIFSRSDKIRLVASSIQSGSNRILGLMRRGYTVESAREQFRDLKRACPSLKLVTQIIVGFPSETEEDFKATCEEVRRGDFDVVFCYPFSEKEGTDAVVLPDKISAVVRKRRLRTLKNIVHLQQVKRFFKEKCRPT